MFQRFRDIPIRRKMMLIIVTASMVTLLLAFASLLVFQVINDRGIIERNLRVQAEIIAANSTAALTFDDRKAGAEVLAALKAQPHVLCARLYRPNKELFAHFGSERDEVELPFNIPLEGVLTTGAQMVFFRPVMLDRRAIGTLYMRFDARAMELELILPFVVVMGGSMLAALLAAVAVSSVFQRALSMPILRLTSTARAVAEHKD